MEQSVTIIRKRDNIYINEQISTEVILPGCGISDEENRLNTIDRLRKDPSVIFILDDEDGRREETATLRDGFQMTLTVDWEEDESASINVAHKGELVYANSYNLKDEDTVEESMESFLSDATWILGCIDRGACFFLDPEHPLYPKEMAAEFFETSDFHWLLAENGFQTERVRVVGDAVSPLLLVYENTVAMVSSRHLSGSHLFIELKQFFNGCELADVERAIEQVRVRIGKSPLIITHLQDGTWAFRMPLDPDVTKSSAQDHLVSRIEEINSVINTIKMELPCLSSDIYEMEKARQYFIYEAIDASLKLSQLSI